MTIADINTLARFLSNTNTTSLTAANLLIFVNQALEEVVGWLIHADGFWQFDDTNYTDINEATGTLIASQAAYTFTSDYLDIEMVEVLTNGGQWRVVPPVDRTQYKDLPIEQYFSTTGFPEVYDIVGEDTIIFYPAPVAASVTLASGLKVRFKRTASLYTSAIVTTGTQAPGFATPWHDILSYMAAKTYCIVYKPDRVPMLNFEIEKRKKELIDHYASRQRDQRKIMTPKKIKYI